MKKEKFFAELSKQRPQKYNFTTIFNLLSRMDTVFTHAKEEMSNRLGAYHTARQEIDDFIIESNLHVSDVEESLHEIRDQLNELGVDESSVADYDAVEWKISDTLGILEDARNEVN